MKIILLLLSALAGPLFAGSREFNYGLHLFESGDYYRAITELDRFRYFEPQSKDAEGALWLVAAAYLQGEKWEQSQKHFEEYLAKYPSGSKAQAAHFFIAESLYEARKLTQARPAYAGLEEGEFGLSARLRLASLSLIDSQWQEAAAQFAAARKLGPDRLGELERWEKLSLEGQAWKPHSRALAAFNSALLPGLGQMSVGYVKDGLSTLLMVGGFAAWSTWFFYSKQETPGILFATVGGVFYLANIHGAVIAAQRANRDEPRARIKQILDEVGQSAVPEPDLSPWIKP